VAPKYFADQLHNPMATKGADSAYPLPKTISSSGNTVTNDNFAKDYFLKIDVFF
jgi:hypothetical protein